MQKAQLRRDVELLQQQLAASTGLADADARAVRSQREAEAAAAECRAAQADAVAARTDLARRTTEMQNLEAVVGELSYEVESSRNSALQSRQLQV